jgi:hypothetical protein
MPVTISAKIEAADKTVVLTSDQAGLPKDDTFRVKHGETVRWVVSGNLDGKKARVRIVEFADAADTRPLFEEESTQHTLAPSDRQIDGTVHGRAHQGHYRYEVALVGGPEPIVLRCMWASGPGQPAEELQPPMGGGVQTEPPPRG